jgi:2-polyprenyl-3-methyl-5-hydroxy-6-metoxy-1,4-benzoquinol methylase
MTEANLTTKQSNYYNNINPDLLAAIPLHASQVLELGAGAGALGAAFKRRNPKAHWIGVELMHEAASLAAHHLDEVIVANAEDEQSSLPWDAWQGRMDAIVLGDVLEHLRDPWHMLARLSTCLSPQGVVIACIPNVGHWTVIQGLLQGNFSYTDQGLLDRTHLRFFTAQSMLELFNRSGLKPLTMRGREIVVNQAGFERFAESMKADKCYTAQACDCHACDGTVLCRGAHTVSHRSLWLVDRCGGSLF